MVTTTPPRLRVPAVMAAGGTAIAVASLIGSGWPAAFGVEVFTVVAAIGYYLLGGTDTDLGAVFGSRADERQSSIGTQAAAMAGIMTSLVAVVGFVIETAVRGTTWPFTLFCVVGAVSFVTGLIVHRART